MIYDPFPSLDYLEAVLKLMTQYRSPAIKLPGDIQLSIIVPPLPQAKQANKETSDYEELDPDSWKKLHPEDQDASLAAVLRAGRRP